MIYKKLLIVVSVVVIIGFAYRSVFWWVRDYYYLLKYGAFVVDYELQCKDRFLFQASIKKLTPGDLLDKIDSNYFSAVGYHSWIRLPTVYPFTMNSFAGSSDGAFLTNSGQVDYHQESPEDPPGGIAYANDAYGDLIEENIVAFSFNEKYLIGKKVTDRVDDIPTANSITSYFIFEFDGSRIERFDTYKELMAAARNKGYRRHRFYLNYTRETKQIKEEIQAERNKVLSAEEAELIPVQLFYSRFVGMVVEL